MVVTNVLINHVNVHSEANMAADSVIFKHTFFTSSHELQEISTQKLQIFPWNTKHFIKNIFYMAFSSCKQHLLKIICLQSHPYFRNILLLVAKRKLSTPSFQTMYTTLFSYVNLLLVLLYLLPTVSFYFILFLFKKLALMLSERKV